MAKEITPNNGSANLPISAEFVNKLLAGVRVSRAQTPIANTSSLLRFLKDGTWVYGVDDTRVEEGSQWAIHPMFIQHGVVCWERNDDSRAANTLLDEKMKPIFEAKPEAPPPFNGLHPYKDQRTMLMACVSGEDAGLQTTYKTSSYGGLKCVDDYLAAFEKQIANDPSKLVGVVTLFTDFYIHKKHGKIFTPHFKVVGWRGVEDGGPTVEPANSEPPKTPAKAEKRPAPEKQPEPAVAAATEAPAAAAVAEPGFRRGSPRRGRGASASPL